MANLGEERYAQSRNIGAQAGLGAALRAADERFPSPEYMAGAEAMRSHVLGALKAFRAISGSNPDEEYEKAISAIQRMELPQR